MSPGARIYKHEENIVADVKNWNYSSQIFGKDLFIHKFKSNMNIFDSVSLSATVRIK